MNEKKNEENQEHQRENAKNQSVNQTDIRMYQGGEGSRYVFIPAVAVSDTLVTQSLLQVLCVLGSYGTRGSGWIYPSQSTIARYLGISRQAVNKSIKRLHELGYLQMRPQFDSRGGRRVNEYRLDMNYELPVERDRFALGSRIFADYSAKIPPATSEVAENIRNRSCKKERARSSSSSEGSYLPTSLAHSAEKPAESTTVTMTAPLTRTRERFDSSALKRDPLYIALAEQLPEPQTYDEWRTWAAMIGRLHRIQVSAADIPTAVKGYGLLYPNAVMTIRALVNQWAHIREGKTREQVAATVRNRNTPQTERAAQAERERRDAERAEVDRLMAEWGYGTRQGEPPRR